MLDFVDGASAREKSYITIGQILEDAKPESKNAPFSIISKHTLVHTVGSIPHGGSGLFLTFV